MVAQSVRERKGLANRSSELPIQARKRFSAKGTALIQIAIVLTAAYWLPPAAVEAAPLRFATV